MFKLVVLAVLFAGIAAQQIAVPFNYNGGLIDPYYGNNYVNRGAYNRGFLGGDYYNRGIYNRGIFGNLRNRVVPVAPTVLPPPIAFRPQIRAGVIPTAEAGARVLSQSNDADAQGSYQYHYETENGIQAQERNVPRVDPTGQVVVNTVEGSYSYTAPNGEVIYVTYTADENGFHPQLHGGQYGALAPADVRIAAPVLKQ